MPQLTNDPSTWRRVTGVRIMGSRWRASPLSYRYAVWAFLRGWD